MPLSGPGITRNGDHRYAAGANRSKYCHRLRCGACLKDALGGTTCLRCVCSGAGPERCAKWSDCSRSAITLTRELFKVRSGRKRYPPKTSSGLRMPPRSGQQTSREQLRLTRRAGGSCPSVTDPLCLCSRARSVQSKARHMPLLSRARTTVSTSYKSVWRVSRWRFSRSWGSTRTPCTKSTRLRLSLIRRGCE
jgi:hypothetical protein